MFVASNSKPVLTKQITATLMWISSSPLQLYIPYLIRYAGQTLCGTVLHLVHKIDMQSAAPVHADTLRMTEVGLVRLQTHKPIFVDCARDGQAASSFLVIDPITNETCAAGFIIETAGTADVSIGEGALQDQHRGLTVWFTGLSGAGKSTLARAVYAELLARGLYAEIVDADVVRKHLNRDLGFSREDRDENVRRIAFVANLLMCRGAIVLVASIAPYRAIREEVRNTLKAFLEVHVHASLNVCEARDPVGLYRKARAGELHGLTGIDDPYEEPLLPEIRCETAYETIQESTSKVVELIVETVCTGHGSAKVLRPQA